MFQSDQLPLGFCTNCRAMTKVSDHSGMYLGRLKRINSSLRFVMYSKAIYQLLWLGSKVRDTREWILLQKSGRMTWLGLFSWLSRASEALSLVRVGEDGHLPGWPCVEWKWQRTSAKDICLLQEGVTFTRRVIYYLRCIRQISLRFSHSPWLWILILGKHWFRVFMYNTHM